MKVVLSVVLKMSVLGKIYNFRDKNIVGFTM